MGKLIKNHLARLITLSSACYAFAASIHGIFWPKIFFDFTTLNLDIVVRPFPYYQIVNAVVSLAVFAFEWPIRPFLNCMLRERRRRATQGLPGLGFWGSFHSSIVLRLIAYPATALAMVLLYQGTNAALYYLIGILVWFWAYCEGEIVCAEPWTLPPKKMDKGTA